MVARHDLATDPILLEGLLMARRGTAFFGRKLNELSDKDLDEPSLLAGWSRRHVIAHVGYNARALARLMEWANTGVETPMYPSPAARDQEIAFGATLNPGALRNLFEHSAIHLNVEWRDTPSAAWSTEVQTAQGRRVRASETLWMRSREVWLHAIDLGNGANFTDLPRSVCDRLLGDICATWAVRGDGSGVVLRATDTRELREWGDLGAHQPEVLSNDLPSLAAWASGRATTGIQSNNGNNPVAPRWI